MYLDNATERSTLYEAVGRLPRQAGRSTLSEIFAENHCSYLLAPFQGCSAFGSKAAVVFWAVHRIRLFPAAVTAPSLKQLSAEWRMLEALRAARLEVFLEFS